MRLGNDWGEPEADEVRGRWIASVTCRRTGAFIACDGATREEALESITKSLRWHRADWLLGDGDLAEVSA